MIAIKFENNIPCMWRYPCQGLNECAHAEGFVLYDWDGNANDIPYLKLASENLVIDVERKALEVVAAEQHVLYVNKEKRLAELTEDLAQVQAGFMISDIETKKAEFRTLLNEVRAYENKAPRILA